MTSTTSSSSAPPPRVIAARSVAVALVAVAVYDGLGLVRGRDGVVNTPTWAVLREWPTALGLGLLYLALAAAVTVALFRGGLALAGSLSAGLFLYLFVAGGMAAGFVATGDVVWPAPAKPLLIAGLYLIVLKARPVTELCHLDHHRR